VNGMMRFFLPGVLIAIFLIPLPAHAAKEISWLHIAQRKHAEGDPEIISVGAFATRAATSARVDIARYKDAAKGEAWGLEVGVGYIFPTVVPLYIGGGVVTGYRRKGGDYFGAYYPEAGIIFPITQGAGVSATGRRYIELFQRTEDVIFFGLVLTLQ
jgi:hypothetical protein